jgi:hypothetical protein
MRATLAAFAKADAGAAQPARSPVFGILKRGGKVTTVMIPDVRKDTLLPIIRQKGVPDSIVYIDSYPAYDVRKPAFPSFSRRPNFASTTEHPASNCEPSNAGPNSTSSPTPSIWDSPFRFPLSLRMVEEMLAAFANGLRN